MAAGLFMGEGNRSTKGKPLTLGELHWRNYPAWDLRHIGETHVSSIMNFM